MPAVCINSPPELHNRSKRYRLIVQVLANADKPLTACEIAERDPYLNSSSHVAQTIRSEKGEEIEVIKHATRLYRLALGGWK